MHLAVPPPAPPSASPAVPPGGAEDEVRHALLVLAHGRLRTSVLWTVLAGLLLALLLLLFPAAPLVVGAAMLMVAAALFGLRTASRITGHATRALAHAEAASQAKSRFLATMSHELRTPLNAVIGAAQLLRADDGDALQRHHLLDAIQRSGGNLLGLIEDILDLSRIEAGQMRLDVQDFHLGDCVDAALATAALGAHAKGLALACRIDPGVPQRCRGDAARLRQLLMNLLGNAVKFTPAGEVLLQIAPADDPGCAPGELRLRVQDSGVGIAPEALAHIFEPFRQGDEGTGRRFGGSGLGLAIVAQLVRAMGGRIRVDSRPGVGTCFTLWLPLPAADSALAAPPPRRPRPVAYIEPHAASAAGLDALLRRLGCAPSACTDAAALRAWCRAHAGQQPAPRLLVCTDSPASADLLEAAADELDPAWVIGMSRHDGHDLGAHHDADLARQRCHLPAGLAKPVAGAALAARLDTSLHAPPPPVPQALLSDAELGALVHVLVVEDDPLNQAIVTRLLRHAGCRVSTADDGLQALDLLRAQAVDMVDLVLMDWHMPGMDGLEVTRRLRAGAAGAAASRLPIVALTANAFAEDRAACLAAGMDDFLTKPVLAQTLLATVTRWAERPLAAPRMPEAAPAGSVASTPGPAAPLAYDPAVLQALPMVADGSQPGCVNEVLEIFNTSLADLLETLPRQIDQGQAETVRRALHSLKSSAASVGALALAALAAEGEALLQGQDDAADAAVLGSPALQALPGRLCEASAQWHLALACATAAAPAPRPLPVAPGAPRPQPEALSC